MTRRLISTYISGALREAGFALADIVRTTYILPRPDGGRRRPHHLSWRSSTSKDQTSLAVPTGPRSRC